MPGVEIRRWALSALLVVCSACDFLVEPLVTTPPTSLDFAVIHPLFAVYGPHGSRYEFSMWLPEACQMQRREGYEISYACQSPRWRLEVLSLANIEAQTDLEATLEDWFSGEDGEFTRLQATVGHSAPGLNYLHVDAYADDGVRTGVITANAERTLLLIVRGRFDGWQQDPELQRMRGSFEASANANPSVGRATIHQRPKLSELQAIAPSFAETPLPESGYVVQPTVTAATDESPWAGGGDCLELTLSADDRGLGGRLCLPAHPSAHELGYRAMRDRLVVATDTADIEDPQGYYEQLRDLGDYAERFGFDDSERPRSGHHQLIFSRCGAVMQLGSDIRNDDELLSVAHDLDGLLKAQLCSQS